MVSSIFIAILKSILEVVFAPGDVISKCVKTFLDKDFSIAQVLFGWRPF